MLQPSPFSATDAQWLTQTDEGQLSVDIFREEDELVIRSLVAGVHPDKLDISIHGDLLTIRGTRESSQERSSDSPAQEWFYRECYWGGFSRSIVLPHEVEADSVKANLKNGVLEIRFIIREQGKKVHVEWEE